MEIGKNEITILTKEEIIEKARKHIKLIESGEIKGRYTSNPDYYLNIMNRMVDSKAPYPLFRLMEVFNYELNNIGIEINFNQYMERLEVLPPVPFSSKGCKEGYIVPECVTDDIYEHIFKYENKYYCIYTHCMNMKDMAGWW